MMKRVHMPALLVMAGGLLWQPPAGAVNPTATITISGTVVSKTCTFDEATPPTVVLSDIGAREFTDTAAKKVVNVPVAITCGAGVAQTVQIVPTGTADTADTTAFKNTGASTGVALRFMDASDNALLPNGTKTVSVSLPGTGERKGAYTFKAGYVATAPGAVSGGNFASVVTLSFNYN